MRISLKFLTDSSTGGRGFINYLRDLHSAVRPSTSGRVSLNSLKEKYLRGSPITAITAYDYPSAVHVERAGFDIALVGDSAAMVVHGEDTTLPMSLDMMLVHCKAVKRGCRQIFVVGDLPFGSYEESSKQALNSAIRMVKESRVDAVKLEGASDSRIEAVESIVGAGIAVMGHLGLTPQSVGTLGGFKPQGKTADAAMKIFRSALKLQDAGCFAIVLECIPKHLADSITKTLDIPTIGIGAGNGTSGQVLVFHDLLGFLQHPDRVKASPRFCKQYAQVGDNIQRGLSDYLNEVSSKQFPSENFTPYQFEDGQYKEFAKKITDAGFSHVLS